jgi:glutathione S-transferase
MHLFYNLVYSPWSEKARWALDHHRIEYRSVSYTPLVDEFPLRLRMGRFSGRVSVPVLKVEGWRWLDDSWAIAQWADREGQGSILIPEDRFSEIRALNSLSEEGLDAARSIGLRRVLSSDDWLASLVPKKLRRIMGPLAPIVSGLGVRRTLRKYEGGHGPKGDPEGRLRQVLRQIREALKGEHRPLLDSFTYADVAVAQIFQFVEPRNLGGFRLGRSGREGYRHPVFAEEFSDLVGWRDWLYENHRIPA